jgi:TANFOR domain-containing protein
MNSEEILDMEFLSKIYKAITNRLFRLFLLGSVLLVLMVTFNASAQNLSVRITTNVLPPYSPYIQDYPGTGNRVQVFISNLSGKELNIRLLGKLEGDNGVIIQTSPNYRPLMPLTLRATDVNRLITRFELEQLFNLNQIEVQGMSKDLLYRGLPLPEGNYQLCVQAFENATLRPLSAEFPMGCSGLIPVRIIEPPILISPFSNEEIAIRTPQTQLFTWSAPVGVLPNQVEYSIRIVELPETNTDPNVYIDAMVLPRSGVEVNNLKTTTLLYGPQYPPLQQGKRYAWRVQAKPTGQKLNFLNDGKSPVQAFTYGTTQVLPGLEYIAMTSPSSVGILRTKSMQVGNNNPLTFTWELDKDFEAKLRKAYNSVPNQKAIRKMIRLAKNQLRKMRLVIKSLFWTM